METKLTESLAGDGQISEGNKVVQVIVVHLDLFTCGMCGTQSTDLLEHIVHKSQHPVSDLFTCELCKLVLSSKACLFQHYSDMHNLSTTLLPVTDSADKGPMIVSCTGEEGTHHVTWDILQQQSGLKQESPGHHIEANLLYKQESPGHHMEANLLYKQESPGHHMEANLLYKQESPGHHMEANLLYQVDDILQHEVRETMETGEDFTHVPSVSSKTVSRSLVKAAKRTMLNSARRDVSCARAQPSLPVKGPMLRRPPILRGSTFKGSGGTTRFKAKPPESAVSVATVTKDCSIPEDGVQYVLGSLAEECVNITSLAEECMNITSLAEECVNITKEQCLHCDYSSADKDSLSTHMRTKHKEGLEFQERLQIITEDKSPCKRDAYIAAAAVAREKRPRKLLQHRKVERQDLPGVYPCNQCSKSFKRLRYLRKHCELHRNDKQFVCEECGKIFKCKGYLKVHMRTHEKNEKWYQCNQCSFVSSINAAIHAHRQIHTEGSVLCDICGYAYTDNSTLAKHKRVHDLGRPFACNVSGCMWRFKTDVMCKAHIRAHTTEGKFRCLYCGYNFRHKHHLQRHESNVHGVKHEKSRAYTQKSSATTAGDNLATDETNNSVNIIISGDYDGDGVHYDDGEGVHYDDGEGVQYDDEAGVHYDDEAGVHYEDNGMVEQLMVIQPDDECGELAYETTDISGFDTAYTLIHEDIHTDQQTV